MIINTGMRTDIPAFYHEWLINRIKEGFVLVRNPYNPSQVTRYCYANTNVALVRENMKRHDPKSPFLIGNSLPGDVIHEAEQKSWLDLQMRLEI